MAKRLFNCLANLQRRASSTNIEQHNYIQLLGATSADEARGMMVKVAMDGSPDFALVGEVSVRDVTDEVLIWLRDNGLCQ